MGPDAQGRGNRLCVYSLGFLRQRRVRRILALAGLRVSTGWPRGGDCVGVWGQRPVARRGVWVAGQSGAPLLRLEDGFLRSLRPGFAGDPPLSLIIDRSGIYYDAAAPSDLETLLQTTDLTSADRARAEAGIAALRSARISKYTPATPPKAIAQDHVLVIDQTAGDASIAGAGAGAHSFARMLDAARAEHPGAEIIVKSHPDVLSGKRAGHIARRDLRPGERLLTDDVNPWDVLDGARAVYTVSSQLGYEAILAGKPVRCFGAAFYAGWGLTDDEAAVPRRTRRVDRAALFHGCHLRYPIYYDPWRDLLTDFETVLDVLTHARDAAMVPDGVTGEVFCGVRLWKRRNVLRFRPAVLRRALFRDTAEETLAAAASQDRAPWFWASKVPASVLDDPRRAGRGGLVEDGFLRSVGLGAALNEASSLVFDRKGIYFDPSRPSDLEDLIAAGAAGQGDRDRAAALRKAIIGAAVTKYNVGASEVPNRPEGRMALLVPGQVEDDASVRLGCGAVRTNLALLEAARAAHPDAWIVYKPHPDVEAGLRAGALPKGAAERLADTVARNLSAAALLGIVDRVWTMTSLMGFEGLMRGLPVTCLGAPFYAGWGLTDDRGPDMPRRTARPSLDDLVFAALIAYPAYRDPASGLPCPPERVVEHLAAGIPSRRSTVLSRLQGMLAGQSWLWR